MSPIESVVRQIRMLHAVLLLSLMLYVFVGEKLAPTEARGPEHLDRAFIPLLILTPGVAAVIRQRMVSPAEEALRLRPDDLPALGRWRAGNLISYVLCEAVALYGFVLRMLGHTLWQAGPFYAVAMLLMMVWRPRLQVSGPSRT